MRYYCPNIFAIDPKQFNISPANNINDFGVTVNTDSQK